MSLQTKLIDAMKRCGYLQKDGENAHFRYRFLSSAKVLGYVNEALSTAGVAIVGTQIKLLGESTIKTKKGDEERVVTVHSTVTLADAETGEKASFEGIGSGQDVGDKAVMKAQSAALKYTWIAAFSIQMGNDPEDDNEAEYDDRVGANGGSDRHPAGPSSSTARGGTSPSNDDAAAITGWKTLFANPATKGPELLKRAPEVFAVRESIRTAVWAAYADAWAARVPGWDLKALDAVQRKIEAEVPQSIRAAGEWRRVTDACSARRLELQAAQAGQGAQSAAGN